MKEEAKDESGGRRKDADDDDLSKSRERRRKRRETKVSMTRVSRRTFNSTLTLEVKWTF